MHRISPLLRVLTFLLTATLLACGKSESPSPTGPGGGSSQPTPIVVFLGDSLTAGLGLVASDAYPSLLQQRAASAGFPHRFVNAGITGDTTADGLRRFDAAVISDTRVLVLALGANDGLQGVPVATVKRNLTDIIERAQRRGIRVMLAGMEAPPTRGLQYSVDFHFIYPDLASQFSLTLMPFMLAGIFGDPALNLSDGFHPNAAGMRVLASSMWPYLEPLLQETSQ